MTSLKRALAFITILIAFALPGVASASSHSYNLGEVTTAETTSPIFKLGQSFNDVVHFTLGAGDSITASVSGFDLFSSLESLSFALVSKSDSALKASYVDEADTNDGFFFFSASHTFNNLIAGNSYDLLIKGARSFGAYSATVTAVPEPGTWTMLVAGLGLIGTVMRRRKATV